MEQNFRRQPVSLLWTQQSFRRSAKTSASSFFTQAILVFTVRGTPCLPQPGNSRTAVSASCSLATAPSVIVCKPPPLESLTFAFFPSFQVVKFLPSLPPPTHTSSP